MTTVFVLLVCLGIIGVLYGLYKLWELVLAEWLSDQWAKLKRRDVPLLSPFARWCAALNALVEIIFDISALNLAFFAAGIAVVPMMTPSIGLDLDTWWHIVLGYLAAGVLLLYGLRTFVSRRRRAWLYGRLRPLGASGLTAFFALSVASAICLFSSISGALPAHRWTATPGGRIGVLDWLSFYSWQALDTVPVLNLTGTLRWDMPLAYRDWRIGVLVVLFKAVAVLPIVTAVSGYFRPYDDVRRLPDDPTATNLYGLGFVLDGPNLRAGFWPFSPAAQRSELFAQLRPLGIRGLGGFYAVLVGAVCVPFLILTPVMSELGWLGVAGVSFGHWIAFYAWHAASLAPGFDAPKALRWQEPLATSDSRVGALALAFKMMLILPTIATIRGYFEHPPPEPESPQAIVSAGT
ncbi:hypothetical protein [Rugosimonospora africana]|uniref:Uncharacterized protein n=1 Tax=Rugosimonospora africana TaxID=556532 RepID=A0A8J3VSD0_9ACTN|nr:hypothetical protein [Rugosimonospora africana]GIH17142.1 hypothetical protein Raf01_53140 [Rugosimonospora africana]